MTDIIDTLAEIEPGSSLDAIRRTRPQAKQNAQRSFNVLLEPTDPGTFSLAERYAVAAYAAHLQAGGSVASAFYAELLEEETGPRLSASVEALADRDRTPGPYGQYREPRHAHESVPGRWAHYPADRRDESISERLAAALEHTHLLTLHPRDARADHLAALEAAGWSADDIVTLSQLISFAAFQIRVVEGLRALAGLPGAPQGSVGEAAADAADDDWAGRPADGAALPSDSQVRLPGDLARPEGFTQDGLGWVPWLAPVPEAELTDTQRAALIDQFRIKSDYFRLLVRNPEALEARTLTDKDIFYNVSTGLPRAEREISASAASRLNGCVYCASVHTMRATKESGRYQDVQNLLDEGVAADLGEPWSAIARASAALTRTPSGFGPEEVGRLRRAGLDEADAVDVISGAAFFNWANRLMLSLGEPEVPARRR